MRQAAGRNQADALCRLRRHAANHTTEREAAGGIGLRSGERVEHHRHHRPIHPGREEMQRHHGAMVEFELVREARLDAAVVSDFDQLAGEIRTPLISDCSILSQGSTGPR